MKLVIATGIYPPDHGGPATFIPLLAQEAVDRGWVVSVVTLADQISPATSDQWPTFRLRRQEAKPFRVVKTVRAIRNTLREADVLFSNGLYEESALAASSTGKPWVAKFVGDPIWERYRNKTGSSVTLEEFDGSPLSKSSKAQRTILTKALKTSRSLITPSQELEDLLRRRGLTKVKLLPNGIEIPAPLEVTPEFDVVTVCRLVSWKHVDVVIQACVSLGCTLKIVGDGPERCRLHQLVDQLNAQHLVEFVGNVRRDQVLDYVRRARLFTLVSSYEGMSFALLEAMSLGKPVVVGDNRGNRAVVTDHISGLVVRPDDSTSLVRAFAQLLSDSHLSEKLGTQARDLIVQQYSLKTVLNRTLEEISDAVTHHKASHD